MSKLAAGIAFVFGLVSIVGGIQGWAATGSAASLVAGGAAGLLLVAAALLHRAGRRWALWISLVVSIALAGRFLPAFLKDTGNVWPAFVMAALGVVSTIVHLLALFVRRPGR